MENIFLGILVAGIIGTVVPMLAQWISHLRRHRRRPATPTSAQRKRGATPRNDRS